MYSRNEFPAHKHFRSQGKKLLYAYIERGDLESIQDVVLADLSKTVSYILHHSSQSIIFLAGDCIRA